MLHFNGVLWCCIFFFSMGTSADESCRCQTYPDLENLKKHNALAPTYCGFQKEMIGSCPANNVYYCYYNYGFDPSGRGTTSVLMTCEHGCRVGQYLPPQCVDTKVEEAATMTPMLVQERGDGESCIHNCQECRKICENSMCVGNDTNVLSCSCGRERKMLTPCGGDAYAFCRNVCSQCPDVDHCIQADAYGCPPCRQIPPAGGSASGVDNSGKWIIIIGGMFTLLYHLIC